MSRLALLFHLNKAGAKAPSQPMLVPTALRKGADHESIQAPSPCR